MSGVDALTMLALIWLGVGLVTLSMWKLAQLKWERHVREALEVVEDDES